MDSLDFVSLVVDFLPYFSAFFQEVQSVLFFDIFIVGNLASNLVRVVNECLLSVLLDLSLLEFHLLLFLDLVHVVLSLDSGLLSEGRSFLLELLLSSLLEIGLNALSLGLLQLFSFSGVSFALFEGSLGPESINLSLSISSLLLKLPKSLDLSFLLLSHSLGLLLLFELKLVLFPLMIGNSCVLVLLLLDSFLFLDECLGVRLSRLFHQQIDLSSLGLVSQLIFLAHLLDVGLKFDLFFVAKLLFFHSHDGSLLYLVNDNLSALLSSILFPDLSLLLFLEDLESFDFHHQIQLLLLLDPLGLQALVLVELFVPNGHYLGVEDHLVHLFDIVELVVHLLLGLGQEGFVLCTLVLLLVCWLHFLSSLFIHLDHFLLLSLRFGQGSGFLLVHQFLFLEDLVFSFDSGGVLDSVQVVLADDYGVVLVVFLGFLSDGAQLVHSDEAGRCLHASWESGHAFGPLGSSGRSASS